MTASFYLLDREPAYVNDLELITVDKVHPSPAVADELLLPEKTAHYFTVSIQWYQAEACACLLIPDYISTCYITTWNPSGMLPNY